MILTENNIQKDISLLASCWQTPRTFALLPTKGAVPEAWVTQAMQSLPDSYQRDHFMLLTSGSTGTPKLVVGERGRAEALASVLHRAQASEEVSETIVTLPFSYCYAFVNQWLWSRMMGRKLRLTEGFSKPQELLQTLASSRDAMLCMVGAQVPLLQRLVAEQQFPGIIRLHFAGGRFPQQALQFLHDLFPNASIYNNYGCAEAMPRLTLRRAVDSSDASNIGRPLEGIELRSGIEGQLEFRSPYRARALLQGNEVQQLGDEDWIGTGDLGEQTEEGSWRLGGRSNDVFKRFGEKISLERLMDTVRLTWNGDAAFLRERDVNGEEGCVLVLAPTPAKESVQDILRLFRRHWQRAYWPLRIEGLAVIPTLSNGKIDLRGLTESTGREVLWRQRL